MKNILWVILLLLILPHNALIGQSRIASLDSLITAFPKEKDKLIKCKVALKIAQRSIIDDSVLAHQYLNSAKQWINDLNDNDCWYWYYNIMAVRAQLNTQPDSSVFYSKKQLEHSKKIADTVLRNVRVRKSLLMLGIQYQSQGNNEMALQYLIDADRINIKNRHADLINDFTIKNTLSQIYLEMDHLSKSEAMARSSLIIAKQIDSFEVLTAYTKIGKVLAFRELLEMSTKYLDSALNYCRNTPSYYESKFDIYSIRGQNYYKLEKTDLALQDSKSAMQYATLVNSAGWISSSCAVIANCFAKNNNKDSVLHYLNLMLQYTKETTYPLEILSNYETAVVNYEYLNDYKNALHYSKKIIQLKDSIAKTEDQQKVNELSTLYETERKNNTILSQQHTLDKKNYFIISSLSFIAVLCLIMVFLYIRFQNNKKQNGILTSKNQQIETLIQELHHRVKNNLQLISSLLSLQSSSSKDQDTKNILQDGQNRVDAMSLIHQKLYLGENVTVVSMKEYTETLVDQLVQSYKGNSNTISVAKQIHEMMLHIDAALPLGLIINEIMTNALKYGMSAPKPELKVCLQLNQDNNIRLSIKDNGSGFEPGSAPKEGLGLKLVRTLVNQLKGNMEIIHQSGTEFVLIFPNTPMR